MGVVKYDYDEEHRVGSRLSHMDSWNLYPMCMIIHNEFLARLTIAQHDDSRVQNIVIDKKLTLLLVN